MNCRMYPSILTIAHSFSQLSAAVARPVRITIIHLLGRVGKQLWNTWLYGVVVKSLSVLAQQHIKRDDSTDKTEHGCSCLNYKAIGENTFIYSRDVLLMHTHLNSGLFCHLLLNS